MTAILDNEEGLKVNLLPKAFMVLYRSREILPSAEDIHEFGASSYAKFIATR